MFYQLLRISENVVGFLLTEALPILSLMIIVESIDPLISGFKQKFVYLCALCSECYMPSSYFIHFLTFAISLLLYGCLLLICYNCLLVLHFDNECVVFFSIICIFYYCLFYLLYCPLWLPFVWIWSKWFDLELS